MLKFNHSQRPQVTTLTTTMSPLAHNPCFCPRNRQSFNLVKLILEGSINFGFANFAVFMQATTFFKAIPQTHHASPILKAKCSRSQQNMLMPVTLSPLCYGLRLPKRRKDGLRRLNYHLIHPSSCLTPGCHQIGQACSPALLIARESPKLTKHP